MPTMPVFSASPPRRFGLRALFGATAAVAMGCGLIVAVGPDAAFLILCLLSIFALLTTAIYCRNWRPVIASLILICAVLFTGSAQTWVGSANILIQVDIRDETTGHPIGFALVEFVGRNGVTSVATTAADGSATMQCRFMTYGTERTFSSTRMAAIRFDEVLRAEANGYTPASICLAEESQGPLNLKAATPWTIRVRLRKKPEAEIP